MQMISLSGGKHLQAHSISVSGSACLGVVEEVAQGGRDPHGDPLVFTLCPPTPCGRLWSAAERKADWRLVKPI